MGIAYENLPLEVQQVVDQLNAIKATNGTVTIQDLRQAFMDLVPAVTADLQGKTTLFYAGTTGAATDKIFSIAKDISKDVSNPLTILGNTKFLESNYPLMVA